MDEAFLEIGTPDGLKQVPIAGQPVTIGRLDDNVLALDDNLVSRHHCVVERVEARYRIRDLGSRNGTKVNGDRITSETLSTGDTITVGNTELVLIVPGQEIVPLSPQRKQEEQAIRRGVEFKQRRGQRGSGKPGGKSGIMVAGLAITEQRDLRELVASLPDTPFDETDIALVNARDSVVHAATGGLGDEDEAAHDAVLILRLLLLMCFRTRATDLHVEPKRDAYQSRVRVDGMMVEVCDLNTPLGQQVNRVVKVLAEIDISQRNIVQEGHFAVLLPDRRVDFRVSFTPSVHGQKLVLRVLDLATAPKYLRDLQLPDWMNRTLHQVSRQDQGMVLVCGPTGSGKTTTLYAVIRNIDIKHRNVITIEDPVEYQIEGVTQLPINQHQGNSFSNLLRSVLRQDPDVILVGEIRDIDTARVAMQAAMTGHLVLSTVHAKDCLGTIFRLLDLGVEPYLVASGLNLVLSQRLLRVLCPECKHATKPNPQRTRRLNEILGSAPDVYTAIGCSTCLDTGYSGRRAVFELLTATDDLRDAILKGANMQGLRIALERTMFTSIQDSAYRLAAEGATSFDEIDRVAGMTE